MVQEVQVLRCGAYCDPRSCSVAVIFFSVFTSKSISPDHAEEEELVSNVKGLLLKHVCVVTII